MKLIPSEPGDFFEQLKKQLSNIFNLDSIVPDLAAKIEVTETEVVVRWQMPPCDDIQVYVDQETVTIIGITRQVQETEGTKVSYSGRFNQRLQLPVRVRGESAQSTYRDGILQIRMHKQ